MWFAKPIEDHSEKVQVHHLTIAAEIINRSRFAFAKRSDNAGAMIVYVDPVAHVHAVPINLMRLVAEGLNEHEWNSFFRKLVRTEIIRASGDPHVLAVRLAGRER